MRQKNLEHEICNWDKLKAMQTEPKKKYYNFSCNITDIGSGRMDVSNSVMRMLDLVVCSIFNIFQKKVFRLQITSIPACKG